MFVLFGLLLYATVNSYGNVGTVHEIFSSWTVSPCQHSNMKTKNKKNDLQRLKTVRTESQGIETIL